MQSKNVFGVTEINKYIKSMFRNDYLLSRVSVRGEVSNLKYHSSGHVYFSLKDADGAISCVLFRQNRSGLSFTMQEGMSVIVSGYVDVYEITGQYQIYAKEISLDGIGSLYEAYEALKLKLSEQGMFDACFKRPIPAHVKTLGVVTAKTGAAVRDIIDVSKRRNPGISIIVCPATVQGKEAPPSIISAIQRLEQYGVDCIIVGRGGGSMEDLWCFNDEGVAQAIFNCSVPIISAVGHETDFTIADFVSDLRAPTPSAAAELAVCDVYAKKRLILDYQNRLQSLMRNAIVQKRNVFLSYKERFRLLSPVYRISENRNRLENIRTLFCREMERKLTLTRHELSLKKNSLHGLSPLNKLGGGYGFVSDSNHVSVKSVKDIAVNDPILIQLKDGEIKATVNDIKEVAIK